MRPRAIKLRAFLQMFDTGKLSFRPLLSTFHTNLAISHNYLLSPNEADDSNQRVTGGIYHCLTSYNCFQTIRLLKESNVPGYTNLQVL